MGLFLFVTPAPAADLISVAPPPGNPSTSLLHSWGEEIGIPWHFGHSRWCALYACLVAHRAGYACPGYKASSFFSLPHVRPQPGVFAVTSHHVGLVKSVSGNTFVMLSGNTGNQIKETVRRTSSVTFVAPVASLRDNIRPYANYIVPASFSRIVVYAHHKPMYDRHHKSVYHHARHGHHYGRHYLGSPVFSPVDTRQHWLLQSAENR